MTITTDREKITKMQEELLEKEEPSYGRMKKENVLKRLEVSVIPETGKLISVIIVPIYEHDIEFLKEFLGKLGYSPKYEEDFNPFFETMCYTVTL